MYSFFQPRQSVQQEEADIKEMIDEEYEHMNQEIDYYKQMEEDYYKEDKEN